MARYGPCSLPRLHSLGMHPHRLCVTLALAGYARTQAVCTTSTTTTIAHSSPKLYPSNPPRSSNTSRPLFLPGPRAVPPPPSPRPPFHPWWHNPPSFLPPSPPPPVSDTPLLLASCAPS
eukprot:366052-Chlamydomonas_euryale.AAC.42